MRDLKSLDLPVGYRNLLCAIFGYKPERCCHVCNVVLTHDNKVTRGNVCLKCNRQKQIEWRLAHSEQYRINSKRGTKVRDRRERGGGLFPLQAWEIKLRLANHTCFYCKCVTDDITCDHVIPLSRGGTNEIDNLVPSCRMCNSRKHTKTASEFTTI